MGVVCGWLWRFTNLQCDWRLQDLGVGDNSTYTLLPDPSSERRGVVSRLNVFVGYCNSQQQSLLQKCFWSIHSVILAQWDLAQVLHWIWPLLCTSCKKVQEIQDYVQENKQECDYLNFTCANNLQVSFTWECSSFIPPGWNFCVWNVYIYM